MTRHLRLVPPLRHVPRRVRRAPPGVLTLSWWTAEEAGRVLLLDERTVREHAQVGGWTTREGPRRTLLIASHCVKAVASGERCDCWAA